MLERVKAEKELAARTCQQFESLINNQKQYVAKFHDTIEGLQEKNNCLHLTVENMNLMSEEEEDRPRSLKGITMMEKL